MKKEKEREKKGDVEKMRKERKKRGVEKMHYEALKWKDLFFLHLTEEYLVEEVIVTMLYK